MQVNAKISKIWWVDTRRTIRSTEKKAALVLLVQKSQKTVDRKHHCLLKDQTHLYKIFLKGDFHQLKEWESESFINMLHNRKCKCHPEIWIWKTG